MAQILRDVVEAFDRTPTSIALLSIQDVADTLKVSDRTVENIIRDGDLKPVWIRGQRRFRESDLLAYVDGAERLSS